MSWITCRWCGKAIKKGESRVTLTRGIHYDHEKCNNERMKKQEEKYGCHTDYQQGQTKLV